MLIWIDGQSLQTASRHRGIGRYVGDLVRALAEAGGGIEVAISFNAAMPDEAIIARAAVERWIKKDNIHIWNGIAEGGEAFVGHTARRRASEIALRHHVACISPDVALSASPFEGFEDASVPLLSLEETGIPLAAICYDFIPIRFAQKYLADPKARATYGRRLDRLKEVPLLLAISEFAAREAREFCPDAQVCAIMAGLPAIFEAQLTEGVPLNSARGGGGAAPVTVLYVGSLDWRKNVGHIARSIRLLPQAARQRLCFEVAGAYSPADGHELRSLWKKLGLRDDRLRFLGSPSDIELVPLYRRAGAVVQPSLMEGFGLTALEAMACGTPVLAARAGALSEVVGNDRALFNPDDPAELAAQLTALVDDPEYAAALRTAGLDQARKFTWRRTAELAIDGLTALVAARLPEENALRAATLGQKRGRALRALRHAGGPGMPSAASLAPLMALAEPQLPQPPRLLVDVTNTARHALQTGIQRVVRKIVEHLPGGGVETVPTYCETPGLLLSAGGRPGNAGALSLPAGPGLAVNASDHIVLLDSSWSDHEAQRSILRSAGVLGAPVTSIIYDLVPIRSPAFCARGVPEQYRAWLGMALEYSQNILCISKSVADDMADLLCELNFGRPVNIGYWRLGNDIVETAAPERIAALPLARGPRFLVVGTLEPRKGHRLVLDAFEALWRSGFEASLVFAGKLGWNMARFRARLDRHPELNRRLFWFDQPPDAELARQYQQADALISASYAEGYGLPLAEAARYGKPVIASDLPAFREIAGNLRSTRFFECGSAQALEAAIRRWKPGPGDGLAVAIPETLSSFSWRESAREFASLLDSRAWYRSYRPEPGRESGEGAPFQQAGMAGPVPDPQPGIEIQFIDGPIDSDFLAEKYIFRITNNTSVVLSGIDDGEGCFGIGLGCRFFGRDGRERRIKTPLVPIPLTLGIGKSVYLAIDIRRLKPSSGVASLEVGLFQRAVGWIGEGARVSLDGRIAR